MIVGVATSRGRNTEAHSDLVIGERAVLVPVKAFGDAKQRLGTALSDSERINLVRRMGERVLAAAAPLNVAVVCDHADVAGWARAQGALVIWEPGRGLNGAVEAGVERLRVLGVREATVVHADLPQAEGIGDLPSFEGGVTLVPDHRDNGTNLIRLNTSSGFRFSYGPGSFRRHLSECERLNLDVRVLRISELSFDVDVPDDLKWA